MSEHPELREALIDTLATFNMDDYDTDRADALLAGPVGKLQAELAAVKYALDAFAEQHHDPERIRREAIGAWVLACQSVEEWVFHPANPALDWVSSVVFRAAALAAGESAVTGEAT